MGWYGNPGPDWGSINANLARAQTSLLNRQARPASADLSGLSGLVNQFSSRQQEAREANEQRYQQMLDIADQTTQQRAADVRGGYERAGADAMQGLARLGMSNTTVAPTIQAGMEREKQSSLNRLADEMQQTKLGIIERREDAYPDMGSLFELIASLAAGGGSQGVKTATNVMSKVRL